MGFKSRVRRTYDDIIHYMATCVCGPIGALCRSTKEFNTPVDFGRHDGF